MGMLAGGRGRTGARVVVGARLAVALFVGSLTLGRARDASTVATAAWWTER